MKIGHGSNLVLININSVQKIDSFLELITRSEFTEKVMILTTAVNRPMHILD
jgi:hypothetical protein